MRETPTDTPCTRKVVSHRRVVSFSSPDYTGPACSVCRWAMRELPAQHESTQRLFIHEKPILAQELPPKRWLPTLVMRVMRRLDSIEEKLDSLLKKLAP